MASTSSVFTASTAPSLLAVPDELKLQLPGYLSYRPERALANLRYVVGPFCNFISEFEAREQLLAAEGQHEDVFHHNRYSCFACLSTIAARCSANGLICRRAIYGVMCDRRLCLACGIRLRKYGPRSRVMIKANRIAYVLCVVICS